MRMTNYKNFYWAVAATAVFSLSGCAVSLDGICKFCDVPRETPPPVVQQVAAPLPADPCAERVQLYGVNFDFNQATLRSDGQVTLDALVVALRRCPATRISIVGHTDSIGTEQYNRILSAKRAHAIVDYLVSRGLNRQMLSPRGAGESEPIATNMYEPGRAQNRRVEVRPIS